MQILFLSQLERIILFSHLTSLVLSDSTMTDILIDLGGPLWCLSHCVGLSGLNSLLQLSDTPLAVAHCTPDSIPHQTVYCNSIIYTDDKTEGQIINFLLSFFLEFPLFLHNKKWTESSRPHWSRQMLRKR